MTVETLILQFIPVGCFTIINFVLLRSRAEYDDRVS